MGNESGKKKGEGKSIGGLIIALLMGASFGILAIVLGNRYFPQGLFKTSNFFIGLIEIYIFLLIALLGFFLHIIIHEGGHLIFGLLTGYKFVSFRVGSLTLVKEDGSLKIKRFNIPGTAGQCLLMPPDMVDNNYPFVIYNLGGVILNLLVAGLTFYSGIKIKGPDLLKAILIFSSLGGLFGALTNGLPLKIGGIANDGYNILSMLISEETRKSFHIQLKVHGLQSQGVRIKDMPIETFDLDQGADPSGPLNTAMVLMKHNYYMDRMDFLAAKESLNLLLPYMDKIVGLYQNEINIERIFLELIMDGDRELVENLYSKNLEKYIGTAKHMIGKKRFMMAYEGLYKEDKEKALAYYEEVKEMMKTYPNKAEAEMELMLADYVKDKMEKDKI